MHLNYQSQKAQANGIKLFALMNTNASAPMLKGKHSVMLSVLHTVRWRHLF